MNLVSIDPGTKRRNSAKRAEAGIALFERKQLAHVWFFSEPEIGGLIREAAALPIFVSGGVVNVAVVEVPRVYPGKRIDPEDLIRLSFAAGLLAGAAQPERLVMVRPSEWKGQRPKALCERLTRATLTPGERKRLDRMLEPVPKGKRHNVIDAVGIGLWQLKRR